ncbi:MAG: transcriptional regulator [Chloroflexi bacterium RBG_13_46_9]|jgi:YebC/PmpR family DNA-binding regulatory protein|nr:MAG: transcriptional regulator [Chloroflexi bacterium RBG_13_46_9]
MSGHSKWSSIKHQKAATDAKRGNLFTKLTREIIVAVRKGGPSPDANYALRLAIQRAKDSSMPYDNISRAIDKGAGTADGIQLQEMVLEGYGPGGAAILVQALSDNRNRTVQNVRNVFTRGGGGLGESGSVAWIFENKGVISIKAGDRDADELGLLAIDAGADDVTVEKDYITVYTAPQKLEEVRIALERNDIPIESAEVTMVPKQTLDLDEKAAIQTLKMIDNLEELDEVRSVSTNVNFSDATLNTYATAK